MGKSERQIGDNMEDIKSWFESFYSKPKFRGQCSWKDC